MNKNLVSFKVITNFVNELSNTYGKKQKSLLLYNRLLQKTGLSLEKAIQKHIDIFKNFCVSNREAILEMNHNKLKLDKLSFNDNVYINIKHIFNISDASVSSIIWKHILTISALLDPEGNAKTVLKKNDGDGSVSDNKEEEIIKNMIGKVESALENKTIDKEKPMESMMNLMSSGAFTDIITDMQKGVKNGSIDIGKLLGSVQGMVNNLKEEAGDDADGMDMPDIGSMMAMVGAMMPPQKIPDNHKID